MRLLLSVGCAAVVALAAFVLGLVIGMDEGWYASVEWTP